MSEQNSSASSSARAVPTDNSKLWIAAGVGAAVLALGGLYLWRSKSRPAKKVKKDKKKAKVETAKKASSSASASASASASTSALPVNEKKVSSSNASAVELPGDTEFFRTIVESINELQQSGDVKAPREMKILSWVHNVSSQMDQYTTRTRLLAAQWLILYHTLANMSARNAEEFKVAVDAQNQDMSIAWELLDCSPSANDEAQALDLLKLDVCQRLKDHEKMAPVFDRVLARGSDMNYEDMMVAFTTAPLLGRWSALRQLGARIIESQGSLEDFHKAALQRPDIPDFEVLYNLAEEEAKKGDTPMDQFNWATYSVTSMRIRLRDVECEDESKVEKVRSAFDPDGQGGWKTIPVNTESTKLVRFGAIAQMLSLSTVPIPMVGPATNDRLKVLGYLVLSPPNGQRMKQTESYSIRRVSEDGHSWNGEYVLTQERVKDNESATIPAVKLVFDMEMSLEKSDS